MRENLLNDPLLRDLPVQDGWKIIGPAVLQKKLGQGGMGAVYKGHHLRLNCPVAIKVMSQHLDANAAQFAERFRREAQVAVTLDHPNLVRCFDVNSEFGMNYMILEFIQGEDAGRRVKRKGRPGLGEKEVCAIIAGASAGLVEAHRRNIVHRDIKPENIMVDHTGRVVLMDLGLAKVVLDPADAMTVTGQAMGTPNYMSPEQWDDAKSAALPSDIWALGVTMYALATGRLPWNATGMGLLMKAVQNREMDDPRGHVPELSAPFIALIERCLHKLPAERITAAQLHRELAHLIGDNVDLTDPAVPALDDSGVTDSLPSPSALSRPTPSAAALASASARGADGRPGSGAAAAAAPNAIDGPTVQLEPGGSTDPTLIRPSGQAKPGQRQPPGSAANAVPGGTPGAAAGDRPDTRDWARQDIAALIHELVKSRIQEASGANLLADPDTLKLQIHARLREELRQTLSPTEQTLASSLIDKQVEAAIAAAGPRKAGCLLGGLHPMIHLPIVCVIGLVALGVFAFVDKSDGAPAALFFLAFLAFIPNLLGIVGGLIYRSRFGYAALRHWAFLGLVATFWLMLAGGCMMSMLTWEAVEMILTRHALITPLVLLALTLALAATLMPVHARADEDADIVELVTKGSINLLQLRIIDGPRLDQIETEYHTPLLHLAVQNDHPEVVTWLLQKRANVNRRDSGGRTALYSALEQHSAVMVKLLINNGADIEDLDNGAKMNALHCAAETCDRDLIKYLLTLKLDINSKDDEGRTPLHHAAYHANIEGAEALLEAGAQVDAVTNYGETPLFMAADPYYSADAEKGRQIIDLLLKAGADPNSTDTYYHLADEKARTWSTYLQLAKGTTRFKMQLIAALVIATLLTMIPILIWRRVARKHPIKAPTPPTPKPTA